MSQMIYEISSNVALQLVRPYLATFFFFFLPQVRHAGTDIHKSYESASNMSGKYTGVQARIKAVVPGAVYTHTHSIELTA